MPLRVRVMSFNIRYDAAVDAPDNTWALRRHAAVQVVRDRSPDVVGVQEALAHQVGSLHEDLPGYECVGRGRTRGGAGELVPLLIRRRRFAVEQWRVFWLSDDPDAEGSIGWDADAPRICTWAVLRDRTTRRPFFAANTHLDRRGRHAREKSAELLILRMSPFAGLPAVVTGDLNATEDEPPFRVLAGAMLRDSYRDVHEGHAPTIHHYGVRLGGKIDDVLCDPNWRVLSAEIVRDRPFGRWPSDHYPVYADLELAEDGP
jgi:endonuclease/exonuclease/phosphatase family metal-dependent hydrolase